EVPAGVNGPLSITTSGGSGDVSLHVSLDEEPDAGAGDWNSTRPGNSETIRINGPAAGVYYIKLYGERAYSNVTLQARHN
ncbi:PPC domain-containing protein, partial [Luteimonas sp. SJ-92]